MCGVAMPPSRKDMPAGATAKWLTIVGIGEDGLDGIGAAARQAIGEADLVLGGARRAAPLAGPFRYRHD